MIKLIFHILALLMLPVSALPPNFSPALIVQGAALIPRDNLTLEYLLTEGSGTRASNTAIAPPSFINLLKYHERLGVAPWANTSTHVTATYAADPFGRTSAARLLVPSATVGYLRQPVTVSAGDHVVSFYVASNTGSAQVVRLSLSGLSSDIVVPATGWVRATYTATLSAGSINVGVRNGTGDVACDLLVACPTLTTGTVPPTYEQENGELATSGTVTWGSGYLSIPAASSSMIGYKPSTTQTGITVYTAFRWPRANTPAVPLTQWVFSATGTGGWQLGPALANTRGTAFSFGNAPVAARGLNSLLQDGEWHIVVGSYDGTTATMEVDGFMVGDVTASPPSSITTGAQYIQLGSTSFAMPGDYAYASQYSVGHSRFQREKTRLGIKARLAARGINVPNGPVLSIEGHSKSVGVTQYLVDAAVAGGNSIQSRAYGVSGNVYGDMSARRITVKSNVQTSAGRKILVVWIGHNDFNLGTPTATLVAQVKSYCLDMLTVYDRLILCTETPASETVSPGINAKRNAYNAAIAADPSFYTYLADVGGDPTIGPDAAGSNTTYYPDGVHLSAAANAIAANIIGAKVTLAAAP